MKRKAKEEELHPGLSKEVYKKVMLHILRMKNACDFCTKFFGWLVDFTIEADQHPIEAKLVIWNLVLHLLNFFGCVRLVWAPFYTPYHPGMVIFPSFTIKINST